MSTQTWPVDVNVLHDLLSEAQHHVQHAASALRTYVACTGDTHTERTILATLEILAGGEHSWLSRDESIEELISRLETDPPQENPMHTMHTMDSRRADDCTCFAVANPTVWADELHVRFPGCAAPDTLLLVEVEPLTYQWVFAGSPALPASDPFPSRQQAWDFARATWGHLL